MSNYKSRIYDEILKFRLRVFGAVLITGPKGCGKTRTAKEHANSFIEFQDEERRDYYLSMAENFPSKLLEGELPRLFDEWQDAPKLWGIIRKYCDDNPSKKGSYILTGSTSANIKTPHTGTLRISTMEMLPMSLYEMGESNGLISLKDLFNNTNQNINVESSLSIQDIIYLICRGGWPSGLEFSKGEEQLYLPKDLVNQICKVDSSSVDGKKRNSKWVNAILKSYARNICTCSSNKTIYDDVSANYSFSDKTFSDYITALEKLYIIQDIDAWSPAIRSKTNIRSSKKKNFVDPSIAVASLGLTPSILETDFNTLGFLFESLCIRDLKVYSAGNNGEVSYYRDRFGLEADCVLHLDDGRYALIEFKLSEKGIEQGANSLNKIEKLIKENNLTNSTKMRMPDLKIIITASRFGYKRQDGIYVIPIGCLKD